MMISFITGKKWSKPTWPYGKKMNCLFLNHERTELSWVKFHKSNPGLITARPVESRNHLNKTCLTKWSMLKEQHNLKTFKNMRNKIVDLYQSGKGYKAISKALGLQRSTVRAIIHKWRKLGTVVNLPRSRPTKITPRAQWRLILEVIKEPITTSKELQASLDSIKVSVHDSTIKKRLCKSGIRESSQAKATADQKEHKSSSHIYLKIYWFSPKTFGQIIYGLMRQKLSLLESVCPVTSGVKPTQHFIHRTSYQQSNMVVVVWWFGAALQLQDLDDLP